MNGLYGAVAIYTEICLAFICLGRQTHQAVNQKLQVLVVGYFRSQIVGTL
jgi:hypothetical protein